jgi:ubiquinone/menaquinone biosynthesis C-methylase UbiE
MFGEIMNTNESGKKPHSAEYFGEERDYWWNQDFLELMGSRLCLKEAKSILDVGCGIGHWGQVLTPYFAKDAQLVGIDREQEWIEKASERASRLGLGERYRYQLGDATKIPFEADTFDLVTCQTLLIHLKDPVVGLKEMLRVLKPGGRVLFAEPNNFARLTVASNLSKELPVDQVVERLKFDLIVQRGKEALGLGFNSIGDFVPGYLNELGLRDIAVYLSDKAVPLFPPYVSKEQQASVNLLKDWVARGFVGWDRDELFSYFTAGGGRRE